MSPKLPRSGRSRQRDKAIFDPAAGPIELVLDLLPRKASPSQVFANILALQHGGPIVLMSGIRSALALNYN